METLQKGMRGERVEAWQYFLHGQGYYWLEVNGVFDDETVLVTKLFQKEHGVNQTGDVGAVTILQAKSHGFEWSEEVSVDQTKSGPNWPPQPLGVKPLQPAEREKLFGKFQYKPSGIEGNPEAITILDDFVAKNIVMLEIPQLLKVRSAPKRVAVHRLIADQTLRLFQAWEDAGLLPLILTWGGSWVPRFVRGSRTTLSNHSWATAFDINVPQNFLGATPALVGKLGSVRELVPLAVEHGFFWGAWFTKKDGMHFEAYKIL